MRLRKNLPGDSVREGDNMTLPLRRIKNGVAQRKKLQYRLPTHHRPSKAPSASKLKSRSPTECICTTARAAIVRIYGTSNRLDWKAASPFECLGMVAGSDKTVSSAASAERMRRIFWGFSAGAFDEILKEKSFYNTKYAGLKLWKRWAKIMIAANDGIKKGFLTG